MTFFITGASSGLGLALLTNLGGVGTSRSLDNLDITLDKDQDVIAARSLEFEYPIFINNAFDGPPHEPWGNFAQTTLLWKVYSAWKQAGRRGHIINIGSIGNKTIVSPDPFFETYRSSKAALEHASKQCSKAFKDNIVPFKTTLLTLDRLDTPLVRSRASWTGNGIDCKDVISFIKWSTNVEHNTCVDEVILSVNLNYSQ